MDEELLSLNKNGTWKIVDKPVGVKTLGQMDLQEEGED